MNKDFGEKLKNKVPVEFYNAYCELMESYDSAMVFLNARDRRAYEIFYEWYIREGLNYYEDIMTNIITEKLDNRFIVFMDIYKSYLDDAIEEDSKQVILEFLYMIPKRMREDFQRFDFLKDEQEFIWNWHASIDLDFSYECVLRPDNICQVSLL